MTKLLQLTILIILSLAANSQVAITVHTEFEKNEKLLLSWPYNPDIDSITAEITGISNNYSDIDILFDPGNNSFDTTAIRNFLISTNANSQNVRFIPANTNTYWLRQYSPVTGYGVFTDTLVRYFGNPAFSNYNRPQDDSIPTKLANYYGLDVTEYGLQFENSNIQYDGLRHLFVGDRILTDNIPMSENDIKFALNAYFNSGIVTIIPTPQNSGGGSLNGIENYIKFLDHETILITSIPDTLPDYNHIEEIAQQISELTNYFGNDFNVVRIPAAPNSDYTFTTTSSGELRSYTNSLIMNNLIIIPSFGLPEYDSVALDIYRSQMPGYNIYFVDAKKLSVDYGGIHTLTKALPQHNYLRILHEKKTGIQIHSPEISITSLCKTGTELESMWLYYKKNNDTAYIKEEVHLVCPQHFGIIDKIDPSDTIHYYLEANTAHTQVTYPLSAPEGNFTFWFDVVSDMPVVMERKKFRIAPNPSTGSFIVKDDSGISDNITVSIYNSNGQLIRKLFTKTNNLINLKDILTTGYYNLHIKHNNNISVEKLIIYN